VRRLVFDCAAVTGQKLGELE
jgi:hypothetical protein